jgi:lactate dehydrogenase-like 2-hydroxyacid dehydrogenase
MTEPTAPGHATAGPANHVQPEPGDLIHVSRLLTDRAMHHLDTLGHPYRVGAEEPPTRAELEAGLHGAAAAVITLTEKIDADLLTAAGPQLRIIANVAVGYDNIDIEAATAAGITVTNTPGVLDRASADHTFALILAATRRIAEGDRLLRTRQPWIWGPRMLVGLDVSAGATLGILGYGRPGVGLRNDLDGSTEDVENVQFSLDGHTFEIDHSAENAARLREKLERFI